MLIPVLAILGAYLAVCAIAFALQDRLIWFPMRGLDATPADAGLEHREVRASTQDGVEIHGWLVAPRPAGSEPRGAVLVCHGNAGNIAGRLDHAAAFADMGCAVLLFDYRGYGASAGRPSELGTYLDAEAAYDHLVREGFAPQRIAVYGESLGSAVAVELARRRPVAAVVCESAFSSLADVAASAYPWLPVRLLLRTRYATRDKIGALGVPVLVVHSRQDDIVPFAQGEALFAIAREPKRMLVTDGRHNDGGFLRRAEWREELRAFLDGAFAAGAAAR